MANDRFNPEGPGYDFQSARAAGLQPDETGHWPSVNPITGQIMKGRQHPTFDDANVSRGEDGKYYQVPSASPYTQTTPGPAPDLQPHVNEMRKVFRETAPDQGY